MDNIEKIIQRAQERGYFDNLPGAGKPQDLSENPFVPEDWRLAYRMLASNGFAPDTVENDKALRSEVAAVARRLEAFARRWDRWTGSPWSQDEREERLAARATFLDEYEGEIRALNGRIHAHNARAPQAMHLGTLPSVRLLEEARTRLGVP